MGNVCSGLTRGKEEKPQTVSLQAYNEIRIIPPTPSPGVLTSSSIPESAPYATSPDGAGVVVVKPPSKLAPLAEPETLSPAPPPKKEVTGAVVIPESPDSDTERLLSPQGDDLTQDAVDSELLLDDTPAESPLITESATTTMVTTAAAVTTTVVASTTTIPDHILSNGFGISDDRIPLTDAEVLCDDSPPPPISPPRKKVEVASPTVVVTTDLASPFPAVNDSFPPAIIGSPPRETPTPTENVVEPNYSSQMPSPRAFDLDGHVVESNVIGHVESNVNGHVESNVNGHVENNVNGLIGNSVVASVNGSEPVFNIITSIEAIPEENEVDDASPRNKIAPIETPFANQKTTAIVAEENGLRTENIDIEIVANGKSSPPLWSTSPSRHDLDHNLNEQKVAQVANGRRKDGDYFLEKTKNEENRIQTMCSTMEENLSSDINEEAEGQIRAFIGKATLLTSKKFKQFKGLCKQNLEPEEGEAFQTTDEDLQGFWDLISIQIEELNASYKDLLEFKSNNWRRPVKINEPKSANTPGGTRRKGAGAKKTTPSPAKSAEAEARNKAREEARRKLIAAKREAAKNMEKSGKDGATAELQENGVTLVNGDDGVEEAEEDCGTGLRRKKSLSFTIP